MRRGISRSSLVIVSLALALSLILVYFGAMGGLGGHPSASIVGIGQFIVNNTYNVFNRTYWAGSPEAVTSIIWDYRGFDTIFETTVLFAAVMAALLLVPGGIRGRIQGPRRDEGLTLIVKTASKIISCIVVVLALNLALRGYISPGGGFAGGSSYAIAPLLLIAGLSVFYLVRLGYRLSRAIGLRTLGLVGLVVVSSLPLLYMGYIIQNQAKPGSMFPGYPVFLGPLYLGGSLIYMNVFEFLVVSMEFIIIFIAMFLLDRGCGGSA